MSSVVHQAGLRLAHLARGLHDITPHIADVVRQAGVETGLCVVFVHHTSASLLIQENADPDVRADLDTFFARLVPDGTEHYRHSAEGPDDMPAHIRSAVTPTSLTIPVTRGCLGLGTWQGVYLWEHRTHAAGRRLTVTVHGEPPEASSDQ